MFTFQSSPEKPQTQSVLNSETGLERATLHLGEDTPDTSSQFQTPENRSRKVACLDYEWLVMLHQLSRGDETLGRHSNSGSRLPLHGLEEAGLELHECYFVFGHDSDFEVGPGASPRNRTVTGPPRGGGVNLLNTLNH